MYRGGFSGKDKNFGAEQKMSSSILANNNFDEYEEIQIVEVDSNSNSCLTFEEQDLNQRGVQL